MIEVWSYADDKAAAQDLSQLNPLRSLAWIDVSEPTMDELTTIHRKFNLPLTELRHALDAKERPRVKAAKDYLLIIFGACLDHPDLPTLPVGFFVTKRYLLSIHTKRLQGFDDIDKTSELFSRVMQRGPEVVLYTLLFRMIKDYFELVNAFEDDIDAAEESSARQPSTKSTQRISELKMKLIYLRKALMGNHEVLLSLAKSESLLKEQHMFEDLNIEIKQLVGEAEVCSERLNNALYIYFASLSARLNEVMNSFTLLASLFIIPMFVTSAYGMNLRLPIGQHPHAFWILMLIMTLAVFMMIIMFRVKKWA